MKKIFVITACLSAAPAVAATVNFTGDCDQCVQYVSCVSQKVLTDLSKLSCDQIAPTSVDTFKNYNETSAVNSCKGSYLAMTIYSGEFGQIARNLVQGYLFDKCVAEQNPDSGYDEFEENVAIAYNLLVSCLNYGFCICKQGYYIQPRGMVPARWGVNSECVQCPAGGTTPDDVSILLDSCNRPAGAFSDEPGSGEFVGSCPASYDSEQERKDSFL